MYKSEDMRRKGEQKIKKRVKENQTISFINILIVLYLYNQHED
jgi:hypothetical protein